MADRKWLAWFVGIVAMVSILLARGQDGAVGAAARQTLMVEVAVCEMSGAAGQPAECSDRRARAFTITVVDAASTPVADDVAPDARGRAEIDVTSRRPTSLTVAVNTAVNVGTRSVSCVANETSVNASLVGGAAGIPIFQVDVATTADITCIVSLFGFPHDDERLDIISIDAEATPVATPSLPSQGEAASDTSQLAPLLPDAESVGPGFVLTEAGTRNLDRMSNRFSDPAEAETRLTAWGFLHSFYRTYDQAPGVCQPRACDVTVEISMSVFSTTEGATLALPYFAQDRADAIGLAAITFETPFADGRVKREARLDGNGEYTTYLQMGERLVRVSMTIAPDLRGTEEGLLRVALVDRLAWATLIAEA